MPKKDPNRYPEYRCQAMVFDMYGRKIKGRCVNGHHFRINRKWLCGRHAALEALHLALKNGTAEPVLPRPRAVYGEVTVK